MDKEVRILKVKNMQCLSRKKSNALNGASLLQKLEWQYNWLTLLKSNLAGAVKNKTKKTSLTYFWNFILTK